MNLVEFGKICGILFFVVMCWYFVFVVFKTNKDYLQYIIKITILYMFVWNIIIYNIEVNIFTFQRH